MDGQVRIDSLFAFVIIDDDDTEGVVAAFTHGGWMPMMGADEARMESWRPIARKIAMQTGKDVRLMRFTNREVVETITPRRNQ